MFRFCLLATLFCLPLGGLGELECQAEIDAAGGPGRPSDEFSNYRAYAYDADTAGECNNLALTCSATLLPNTTLTGRSWYITNIRPSFGLFYDNRVIQDFRVQCARGTFLHLYLQHSNLPSGDPLANGCEDTDFVRVTADGLDDTIFCGDLAEARRRAPDLDNFGRGRIFPDGKARISFCSNNVPAQPGDTFDGFVVRATCINPLDFLLPSCTDFPFFDAWDPEFTGIIENLPPVERAEFNHPMQSSTIGKREAERMIRKANREKRFVVSDIQVIQLEGGDCVQFSGNTLTVTINGTADPTVFEGVVFLFAETPTISTRAFLREAPLKFFGPGRLEIKGIHADLRYTIPDEEVEATFLPRLNVIQAANLIHEYIFNNWVLPYPVVDSVERNGDSDFITLPLQPGNDPPKFPGMNIDPLRSVASLDFVKEDFNAGRCYRAIRIFDAPTVNSRLPLELTRFCAFFAHSCDLILRHACRDANRLDPLSVGK